MAATPSILIVDDKPDLLDLFAASLRRLRYLIITAQDGETAMQILQEQTPLLVLLDIAMPYPGGLEVLHHLRSDPRLNATKVMILTAVPSRLTQDDRGMVDAVVTKPITPRALEAAVVNLIGS
ncbi:MAG: response regulator [Anaerolineae bacterium]|nr:response regulator [Anaerolineae bacterium]